MKVTTEKSRTRTRIQIQLVRGTDPDPDPYQNVTDPEWLKQSQIQLDSKKVNHLGKWGEGGGRGRAMGMGE